MTNCDEAPSVFNGHYEIEVTIDRPVAEVWEKYLDIASWVTSHRIEDAAGEPGSVGSITRVYFDEKIAAEIDMPHPRYHYCKIIKLEPLKHYLLKTYSEKGGSYGSRITAFDNAKFEEINGKTHIIFTIFAEIISEEFAKNPELKSLETSREGMMENLNNLKRICERG